VDNENGLNVAVTDEKGDFIPIENNRDDFIFSSVDHVDHVSHVAVGITSTDRLKPGRLKICKGVICEVLEPGTELKFDGYLGDKITVEVVQ